jgi:hypothetical protein
VLAACPGFRAQNTSPEKLKSRSEAQQASRTGQSG